MSSHFKTSKGSVLPLMMFERKKKNPRTGLWEEQPPQAYLQVAHRVVWFREDHPFGKIETECMERSDKHAIFRARIWVREAGQATYEKIAEAHKREDAAHFLDYIEKAETSAVGRALALCGYGTQFAPDMNEEERLADAPINAATKEAAFNKEAALLEAEAEQNILPPLKKKISKFIHIGKEAALLEAEAEQNILPPLKEPTPTCPTHAIEMKISKFIPIGHTKEPFYCPTKGCKHKLARGFLHNPQPATDALPPWEQYDQQTSLSSGPQKPVA